MKLGIAECRVMTVDELSRQANSKNRNSGILCFEYIIPITPILAAEIFSIMVGRRLANMARYLAYDEEMKRLRILLDTVLTDEESLFDDEEIDDDEEYNSNHDSSTDGDTDIEVDIDLSNENDFSVGQDKITTWKKEKFRTNVRVSVKHIIMKLPGNTTISRDVRILLESWKLLMSDEMVKHIHSIITKSPKTTGLETRNLAGGCFL
ncbi:hypothetical protein AVEN_239007-1, partial [Araneus ventricosus]